MQAFISLWSAGKKMHHGEHEHEESIPYQLIVVITF